ncbi:hypothetical protein GOP47_0019178 [Adiantum capillus-veneris]|uniref:Pentatricopeptide repeat-containing protein n=1 Tax=Adiantum capillus-veneris TaxID=13818 RepID=A0A9D4UFT3_ADICA|nr:hypothetical protein GOP47_0019178 [Adiantum capillus-veneris]
MVLQNHHCGVYGQALYVFPVCEGGTVEFKPSEKQRAMGATSHRNKSISKSAEKFREEAILARQVKHGEEVNDKGWKVKGFSLMTALKTCAAKQDLYQGSKIHADIRSSGLLEKDTYLGSTLVSMYAKCGALVRAQQVIDELPVRDVVSWTALIAGYVQHGHGKEALGCFHQMQSEGLSPNAITYSCILKACGIMQDAEMGKQIHDEIVSQGLLERNVVLGNALVDMYAKCGVLTKAHKVLDELSTRDVISWTALIAGYVQRGHGKEALGCFHRMRSEGLSPNAITYACTLKACGIMQEVDMGKQIHDEIVSEGLLEKNVVLGNALVDMYAKCGVFTKAHKVLDELPTQNVISWTTLIAGYVRQEQGRELLAVLRECGARASLQM